MLKDADVEYRAPENIPYLRPPLGAGMGFWFTRGDTVVPGHGD